MLNLSLIENESFTIPSVPFDTAIPFILELGVFMLRRDDTLQARLPPTHTPKNRASIRQYVSVHGSGQQQPMEASTGD